MVGGFKQRGMLLAALALGGLLLSVTESRAQKHGRSGGGGHRSGGGGAFGGGGKSGGFNFGGGKSGGSSFNFGGGKSSGGMNNLFNARTSRSHYNEGYKPHKPSTSDYVNFGVNLINSIPQNRYPSGPTYQPQYVQPTYVQPETYIPEAAPASNYVPPPEVNPVPNYAQLSLTPADPNAANALSQAANEQAATAAKEMDDYTKGVSDPAGMISKLEKDADFQKLPPDKQQAIKDALNKQPPDPAAVKTAMAGAGMPPGITDQMVSRTEIGLKNQELQQLVANGGNATAIQQKAEELQQAMNNAGAQGAFPYTPAQQAALQGMAAQLTNAAQVRDVITTFLGGNGVPPAGPIPFPGGQITIVQNPLLTAGEIVALAIDILLVGTGQGGGMDVVIGTAEDAGLPVVQGDALATATEDTPGMTGGGVYLTNPKRTKGTVNFAVGGQTYTMKPNEVLELSAGETIVFDRGNGGAHARYTLEEGRYEFTVGANGWDLQSMPALQVTLDNSANAYDFNFVVNNERRTVKARQKLALASNSVAALKFNNGNNETDQKVIDEDGVYKVGVNPNTNGLDVFVPQTQTAGNLEKKDTKPVPTGSLRKIDADRAAADRGSAVIGK